MAAEIRDLLPRCTLKDRRDIQRGLKKSRGARGGSGRAAGAVRAAGAGTRAGYAG